MTPGGSTAGGERTAGAGPEDPGCAAHPGAAAELRTLALAALDRLEPALLRLRTGSPTTAGAAGCTACPVCAVLAVLRGERPELAATVADQLGGLLAVLRAALEEGDPAGRAGRGQPPQPSRPAPGRRVQRIPVERVAR